MRLDKKTVTGSVVLSLAFTIMQIAGYQISMFYGTSVHRSDFFQSIGVLTLPQCFLLGIGEFALWFVILYALFLLLDKLSGKTSEIQSVAYTHPLLWPGIALLLFLCWIPALMACYPGCYNYDAIGQVPQAMYEEVSYNTHHPLLHTLVMGKIMTWAIKLTGNDLSFGIYIYCIFQMLVCSVILAYSLYSMLKICKRKLVVAISFLYYAFFPTIVLFAMSTTKDVLFSLFFHLVTLCVYEMYLDLPAFFASPKKIVRFVLLTVIACMFRNNGIYAILIFAFFAILLQREYRIKILLLSLCLFCIYTGCSKGLEYGLQAEKGGKIEMLSVPIQQLARVYQTYGENAFTEDELQLLYTATTAESLRSYNPFSADNVKNFIYNSVVVSNMGDYAKMWVHIGIQYPVEYICSFLENTYQAWYPGTSVYTSPGDVQTSYFAFDMNGGVEREIKLPRLAIILNRISTEYYYQKIPVVRLLFSTGAMLWVAVFSFVYGVSRKRREIFMPMILVLAYCLTSFLGPVSLVRYYLILFYGFPVFVSFLLSKDAKKDKGIISEEDENANDLLSKIA